MIRGEEPT
jgi:hypothetical protein